MGSLHATRFAHSQVPFRGYSINVYVCAWNPHEGETNKSGPKECWAELAVLCFRQTGSKMRSPNGNFNRESADELIDHGILG